MTVCLMPCMPPSMMWKKIHLSDWGVSHLMPFSNICPKQFYQTWKTIETHCSFVFTCWDVMFIIVWNFCFVGNFVSLQFHPCFIIYRLYPCLATSKGPVSRDSECGGWKIGNRALCKQPGVPGRWNIHIDYYIQHIYVYMHMIHSDTPMLLLQVWNINVYIYSYRYIIQCKFLELERSKIPTQLQ